MNQALVHKLLQKAKLEEDESNFDRAFELSEKALAFAKKNALHSEASMALLQLGDLLRNRSVKDNQLDFLTEAINYFEDANKLKALPTKRIIDFYTEIGRLYFEGKQYNNAFKYYTQVLESIEDDSEKSISLNLKLAKVEEANRNFEGILDFLKKAESFITTEIPDLLTIECYQALCDYYVRQSKYSEISTYAPKVVELARKINHGEYEARALNTCAIPHAVRGEYKDAFEYMKQALTKAENLKLKQVIASTLVNLGNIFAALYNYEEAIKSYERVINDYESELQPISIGITYYNLGNSYYAISNTEKAEQYFRESLKLGKQLKHKLLISRVYFELTKIYMDQGDLETVIAYSFEAEKNYPTEGKNRPGLDSYLANICELNLMRKEYENAIKYGEEAIFYSIQSNNLKTLKRTYKNVANAYKGIKRFDLAFDYLEQYSETSEEFMLQMRERKTIDLEIQYALKDKEVEIKQLKQEMQINELKLTYQEEIKTRNIELKMSNQALRQFTYAISHDLKEPLRMINSFSKLWYRKNKAQADKTDTEYFNYINNGSERMTSMLQGLLDYATVGQNARPAETVNLNDAIEDTLAILYVRVQENEAKFVIDSLPTVQTHKILVLQLLQNLVSNAIKFKKPDIAPIIKISYETSATHYKISISDNGIGIPEKHLETVFKIFKRLHTKEEYEGTGIGLSLCQKIAVHLGGELTVSSVYGEGATFSFTLPK
jgi:signal transduction histidine kinase